MEHKRNINETKDGAVVIILAPMPRQNNYNNNYNQRPSNYQPGLNNNLRYTPNDCAVYVNC